MIIRKDDIPVDDIEIVERLTRNQGDIEALERRVTNVEDTTKAIHDMNTNISLMIKSNKDMNKDIKEIKSDVTNLKTEVSDIKMQPAKDYKSLIFEIIKWLVLFGLGFAINTIIK